MKKPLKTTLLLCSLSFLCAVGVEAQTMELPSKIIVKDYYELLWRSSFNTYELVLGDGEYSITRTLSVKPYKFPDEDVVKDSTRVAMSPVPVELVKDLIEQAKNPPRERFDYSQVVDSLPIDSIAHLYPDLTDLYGWKYNPALQQYTTEKLHDIEFMNLLFEKGYEENLQQDYEDSHVTMEFFFSRDTLTLETHSDWILGLPNEINGVPNYDSRISLLLNKIIPVSIDPKRDYYSTENVLEHFISLINFNDPETWDRLVMNLYSNYQDSLEDHFSYVNGYYFSSKKLEFFMKDSALPSNLFFIYDVALENQKPKIPISKFISDLPNLLRQLEENSFFLSHITNHPTHRLIIHYPNDGNVEVSGNQSIVNNCKGLNTFEGVSTMAITLVDDLKNYSSWISLSNGQYVLMDGRVDFDLPVEDENFINCE